MAGKKRAKWPDILRYMIICIAAIVSLYSAYQLFSYYRESWESKKDYAELESLARETESSGTGTSSETGSTESLPVFEGTINFTALQMLNEDICAYITVPGTSIDYPVVMSSDDEHYLRYTASNIMNNAGAIFIQYQQSRDIDFNNTLIYGHNRNDGTMFSDLLEYKEYAFWQENPYVLIETPTEQRIYKIFAAYSNGSVDFTYVPNLTDVQYAQYLEEIDEKKLYDTGVEVTTSDTIISLITCTEDAVDRFVVHAVRIQ